MSQQDCTKLEVKFWKSAKAADKTRAFANKLFEGAAKDITALDAIIVKHADNWRFERLAAIDRAILRLAIHEMNGTDTPPQVILNEAGGMGEKISPKEAGSIVDGGFDAGPKSVEKIGRAAGRGKGES